MLHFRIAIPADLRHHFACKEIYRSLETANVRQAAPTAQALTIELVRIFTELRQLSMSELENAPKSPLIDEDKLKDLLWHTKRRLQLLDQNDALQAKLDASEAKRRHDKAQHLRDLKLVLIASRDRGLPPAKVKQTQKVSAYIAPYFESIPADS